MKHFIFLLIGIVNLLLITPSNVLAQSTHNGYEYVDLGLSVKWATCNVGSSSPEDYGYYFAWGEISYKSVYTDNNYKFYGESINHSKRYKKYNSNEYRGHTDNKTLLDPEDDVAHVMWGGDWYLPSICECDELIKNCTWTWVTQNGKNGFKATSKINGNSIFLPAADCKDAYHTTIRENEGFYLTNQRDVHYEDQAYCLYFLNTSEPDLSFISSRSQGSSARPVFRPRVQPMVTSEHVGHEYVDLGLSVKWATCNLGAKSHENRGDLYRWGELDAFTSASLYDGSKSYKWKGENGPTKYNKNDNMTKLEPQDDAAHVTWGGSWRMPSYDEWVELITNCDGEYLLQNGVSGLLLTSKRNGNTLFLPLGNYWSSSLYTRVNKFALTLDPYDGFLTTLRISKLPIRPVCP